MSAYVLMDDQELGRGSLLKRDSDGICVSMEEDIKGPGKMSLQTPSFCSIDENNILGGGLWCHRAKIFYRAPGSRGEIQMEAFMA